MKPTAQPRQPHLVLLSGPMRSGKDTVGQMLLSLATTGGWKGVRLSLGDGVREELADVLKVPLAEQNRQRAFWRSIWQFWATEVRRSLDPYHWLRKWSAKECHLVEMLGDDFIVVPDVRFPNEHAYLTSRARGRGWGHTSIRILRPSALVRHLTPRGWHSSEHWWKVPADMTVWNVGSLENLQGWVEGAWKRIDNQGSL